MASISSYLLTIPREVRDLVFNYLLISQQSINLLKLKQGYRTKAPKLLGLTINVLFTCHQLYEEGRQVLYGSNSFLLNLYTTCNVPIMYGLYTRKSCLTCIGAHTFGCLQKTFLGINGQVNTK